MPAGNPALDKSMVNDPAPPALPPNLRHSARADGLALSDGKLRERLRQAMRLMDLAEAASGATQPALMCHAHKDMAIALSRLQAYSPAQTHLAQAMRWALVMGATDLRADLQCALAEVATSAVEQGRAYGASGPSLRKALDHCRDLAFEAARLAPLTTDPHWELRVLLRASDVLDRCGDHDDAQQLQQQALAMLGQDADGSAGQLDPAMATTVPAELWRPTAAGNLM